MPMRTFLDRVQPRKYYKEKRLKRKKIIAFNNNPPSGKLR